MHLFTYCLLYIILYIQNIFCFIRLTYYSVFYVSINISNGSIVGYHCLPLHSPMIGNFNKACFMFCNFQSRFPGSELKGPDILNLSPEFFKIRIQTLQRITRNRERRCQSSVYSSNLMFLRLPHSMGSPWKARYWRQHRRTLDRYFVYWALPSVLKCSTENRKIYCEHKIFVSTNKIIKQENSMRTQWCIQRLGRQQN